MSKLKVIVFVLGVLVFFSCKKRNDDALSGLDVQPENDLLGITISDSTSLFMYTQKVDSVRSYNDQFKFLGSVLDPIFGRTDASIYTNLSIANNLTNVSFGVNPIIDSAEIVIRNLSEFIGDTSTVLNYEVFLLNDKIKTATNYYTNNTIPHSLANVTTAPGRYKFRNGYLCLVLKIDNNLAQYILQTEANLVNNVSFQNANKGFYITTANTSLSMPGSGALRRFNLDDDLSGLNLYYHNGNSTSSKGQSFKFAFRGSDALRFNNIKHNYTSGAKQNLYDQITGDSLKGSTNVYLNSFGGTRTRVYLPFIKNFSDSQNVSISRAELIIKVDESYGYNSNFDYPTTLALIGCGPDGTEELVYDQLETTDFIKYGGRYDAGNKRYVFNIARQIQKIITNKIKNYGFYLVNAQPSVSFTIKRDDRYRRVVFGGKNNSLYTPVFKVTYVKYPYDK